MTIRHQRGFTLVELIVTMSIMVTLLAFALLNTRQTSAQSRLRQAAESLRQVIYTTQSLALAPAVDKTSGSDGYVFHLVGSSPATITGYEIREMDILDAQGVVAIPGRLIKHYDLPATIHIQPLATPFTDLDFSITGQGKIVAPQPANGRLDLVLVGNGATGSIDLIISTITGQVATSESF